MDRVPFIGRHSMLTRRIYVATGMKGWGMTNGTAAVIILSDMIRDRQNPWATVFDPHRFTSLMNARGG